MHPDGALSAAVRRALPPSSAGSRARSVWARCNAGASATPTACSNASASRSKSGGGQRGERSALPPLRFLRFLGHNGPREARTTIVVIDERLTNVCEEATSAFVRIAA
jgi:hypothetical protein